MQWLATRLLPLAALAALAQDPEGERLQEIGGIPVPDTALEDLGVTPPPDETTKSSLGGIPPPTEAPLAESSLGGIPPPAEAAESSPGGIPPPDEIAGSSFGVPPLDEATRSSAGARAAVFDFVDWHMNSGQHRHLTERDLDAFEGHSPEEAAALLAKANMQHGRRLLERSKTCGKALKKEGSRWLYGAIKDLQAADVDECCKLCAHEDACFHWEFNYVDNTCGLKGDNGYLEHAGHFHYWIAGDVEERKPSPKQVHPRKVPPPRGVYPSDLRMDL